MREDISAPISTGLLILFGIRRNFLRKERVIKRSI
jgi:hypothetical protein